MKKLYNKPHVTVVTLCHSRIIAISGNFEEGETMTQGIYTNDVIDGNQAWVKGKNVWDDEW